MEFVRRRARPMATVRSTLAVRRLTLGLIVPFIMGGLFLGDLVALGEQASRRSDMEAAEASSPFRITSPTDSSLVGDGNLIQIEGIATDSADGVVDRIEVAFDGDDTWATAQRTAEDPTRWTYLWTDPSPGRHRIRARAFGIEPQGTVEQAVTVEVRDVWSSSFVIDNPYAGPGVFRRGQVHAHSTNSFDGWTSVPPAQLALEYKKLGYQFLVITDHDVISHPTESEDASFIAIPGYESTAETGHITGMWVETTAPPEWSAQERLDHITAQGGLALLNHPGWQVGWNGADFRTLRGYFAFEIWNQITSTDPRAARNVRLWHEALNANGWGNRIWAMAVDDRHDIQSLGLGWVEAKAPELTDGAIRRALQNGAFYASNGPRFGVLGVLKGAITASSPDAPTIRFIDQDLNILAEGPGSGASYQPKGTERFIRVEATMPDGRTAWSQPFWLVPNAPRVSLAPISGGAALRGETLPNARVHISDNGQYVGNMEADSQGTFEYRLPGLSEGRHDFWILATAPWPDRVEGRPTLLAYDVRMAETHQRRRRQTPSS